MFSDPEKVLNQIFVAEGMTVADFGAGAGFYTFALARRVGPYGRVFAVDVHPDMLRRIKNQATKEGINPIDIIQGDLEKSKGSGLVSASVDRVILANTLFQNEDIAAIVRETKRVLKHDGKVVVVDWDMVGGHDMAGAHKHHYVSKEEAREVFEKEGFTFEQFIDAGSHHYGLLYAVTHTPMPGEIKNVGYTIGKKNR